MDLNPGCAIPKALEMVHSSSPLLTLALKMGSAR